MKKIFLLLVFVSSYLFCVAQNAGIGSIPIYEYFPKDWMLEILLLSMIFPGFKKIQFLKDTHHLSNQQLLRFKYKL
jgi:hypothetical protein